MSRQSFEIESSLLEVGAEVYKIKHELKQVLERQERFSKSLRGLRTLLDEKGVITAEDFETAVDMVDALETSSMRGEVRSTESNESGWRKKAGH